MPRPLRLTISMMGVPMTTFLLIHGAWHGGWCWEEVVPLLAAEGHVVLAPDLPGMGADHTPLARDVLGQWTDAVAAIVEAQDGRVVLVGHSSGAAIASAVAERRPDRVALVTYLAGFVAADGGTIAELMLKAPSASAFVPGADSDSVGIDPAQATDIFYGLCPPDTAARAVARLTDTPLQPSTVRLHLSPDRFGRVPLTYIETTEDHGIPIALQREAQAHWPLRHVVTLPSDHSPFYSMPKRLAEVLIDLATDSARSSTSR